MKNHHIITSLLLLLTLNAIAESEALTATALLKRVGTEKPVKVSQTTITGDLDFTQLRKKYPGGSYGIRGGKVKEFFTKLKAPLVLEDCVVNGGITTFSEEKRGRLLKENFVAFDAPLILRRCQFRGPIAFERLTFYDQVIIEDCVFDKKVRFEEVRFAQPPIIRRNGFKNGLTNRKTNWDQKTGRLASKEQSHKNQKTGITVTLKNTSLQPISIQFGKKRWNLSPQGTSTLEAANGTKIYLIRKGKKQRVLLAISPEIAGETFDVAKL